MQRFPREHSTLTKKAWVGPKLLPCLSCSVQKKKIMTLALTNSKRSTWRLKRCRNMVLRSASSDEGSLRRDLLKKRSRRTQHKKMLTTRQAWSRGSIEVCTVRKERSSSNRTKASLSRSMLSDRTRSWGITSCLTSRRLILCMLC